MPARPFIAFALLALLAYGAVEAAPLIAGPSLTIASPIPYETSPDGRITLSGQARHTETLWLNGAPLLIDEDGNFSASLVLPPGGAILALTATDRFGREITERTPLFVRETIPI